MIDLNNLTDFCTYVLIVSLMAATRFKKATTDWERHETLQKHLFGIFLQFYTVSHVFLLELG